MNARTRPDLPRFSCPPADAQPLTRGGFPRLAYRLGRSRATGMLVVYPDEPTLTPIAVVVAGGAVATADTDPLGRDAARRLSRIAGLPRARWALLGGPHRCPPDHGCRPFLLGAWARKHLEAQLDAGRARDLAASLSGVRMRIAPEHVPDTAIYDAADRRVLAALCVPRRLDQLWPLARTSRYRLLALLYFLREIGALELGGVAAPRAVDPPSAYRVLGVQSGADPIAIKRAYRRLARTLHPDMHPSVGPAERRALEQRLVAVTHAYRQLAGGSDA